MTYEDILKAAREGVYIGRLSTRTDKENPNHHLWNNRGTWWCHFTLYVTENTSERVRISLKTKELEVARERRDEVLDTVGPDKSDKS